MALQGQIKQTREAIRTLDEHYETASSAAISQSISSARQQSKIVAAATLVTLLIAAWFIYSMISGVTEPLNAAVDLAERIAAGNFATAADRLPRRDLGNLLASLQQMSEKLRRSQLEIEEDQRRLERLRQRAAEMPCSDAAAFPPPARGPILSRAPAGTGEPRCPSGGIGRRSGLRTTT